MTSAEFSSFYKNDMLSDIYIYLIPETTPEPKDGSLPALCRGPTPVHGLLLAALSDHFKVKINVPLGMPLPEVDGRKRLFLQVGSSLGLWLHPCQT